MDILDAESGHLLDMESGDLLDTESNGFLDTLLVVVLLVGVVFFRPGFG